MSEDTTIILNFNILYRFLKQFILSPLIIRYSYSFLISRHVVILSVVERSLHALRPVEMTEEGRLVGMTDFLVSLILLSTCHGGGPCMLLEVPHSASKLSCSMVRTAQ